MKEPPKSKEILQAFDDFMNATQEAADLRQDIRRKEEGLSAQLRLADSSRARMLELIKSLDE